MHLNYLTFFKIAAFSSTIIVFGSFFFEFFYNLKPCKLCQIQRLAWIIYMALSYIALFQKSFPRSMTLFSSLFIATIFIIGLYHSSVEAGIIENFFSCTPSSGLEANNIEELNQIILSTENNDCAFPKFSILGFTLANIGVLASFLLLTLNLLLLKKVLFR